MKRIVLVHWNREEAEAQADSLRAAGYAVTCHTDARANPASLRSDPPDVFVIDLRRIPSQGREIGGWLRRQKPTRTVPLVFVEGDPVKTARVQELLPDATYTSWDDVLSAVATTIARPPAAPVVPGAMDAYRGVPLTKRLGIRPGDTIALFGAPDGYDERLGRLPEGAEVVRDARERIDVIVWFVPSGAELEQTFRDVEALLDTGGRLWIAWPKKMSGVVSDLSQSVVRAFGLNRGFVDYKIVSMDATWSGLCFARRS